ncbi:hypothetical protein PABG_11192 [Paracoccidioides brasiliensis Pb03]|nr:hypothetical protein PABG_11192 [Paracoccidioides brasiliensis Pb03]
MNRRAVLDWPSGPHLFLHKYERISVPTCTSCLPIKNRCFLAPAGRLVSTSSVRRQDGETPPEQNDYQRQLGHRAREKLADKVIIHRFALERLSIYS